MPRPPKNISYPGLQIVDTPVVKFRCPHCKTLLPEKCFENNPGQEPCKFCEKELQDKSHRVFHSEDFRQEKLADGLIDELAKTTLETDETETILSSFFRCAGGGTMFSKYLWDAINKHFEKPLPQVGAINAAINMVKLKAKKEDQKQQMKIANMTDEQIRREQELTLLQLAVDATHDPKKLRELKGILVKGGMDLIGIENAKVPDPEEEPPTIDAQATENHDDTDTNPT